VEREQPGLDLLRGLRFIVADVKLRREELTSFCKVNRPLLLSQNLICLRRHSITPNKTFK